MLLNLYVPAGTCTGQLLAIAVLIVVWKALLSSWLSSPTAPLHFTSIQGRPEHIRTSQLRVAVPVVDSVEKLPGDCASALQATSPPAISVAAVSARSIHVVGSIRVTTGARQRPGRSSRHRG
jgi:hypothetical protein